MNHTSVQKLARVLKVLVILLFVCNIAALLMVPALAALTPEGVATGILRDLSYLFGGANAPDDHWPFWIFFALSWVGVWEEAYTAILCVFLWICGAACAVILWQAKRVLDTILKGETFSFANAANMKRAAICCFVISGAALGRLIWILCDFGAASIISYNTLFIPVFLVAGLVCMVMSALFRQAAELKAENDLTI